MKYNPNAAADRGAFSELHFIRCARGFVFSAQREPGYLASMYAFDRVEDAAAWLIAEYGPPRDTDGSPKGTDPKGLDGEAATAGAEGIAQTEHQHDNR